MPNTTAKSFSIGRLHFLSLLQIQKSIHSSPKSKMIDAVVMFLFRQMKQGILGNMDTISDVTDKLKNLMAEARSVKATLHDAAGVLQAEQLREMDLEKQLKEVVYEVEDTIESSLVQMMAAEAANKCFRRLLISKLGDALQREIDSISSRRLEPITRRIQACRDLGIQQARLLETNQVPSDQLMEEVPRPPPKNFVGLEDEAKTLISSLMEETERLGVIAITGMPGIGKTTLASKIFHDNRIHEVFPTRIWVADFRSKELCLSILKQSMNPSHPGIEIPEESCSKDSSIQILNDFSEMNDDELIDEVRYHLKKRKYLLVMDDVWDAEFLNSVVANMLPEMGKVLITSCNNRITEKPHVLRFLNEKESWDLLQMEVFGELDKCPDTLLQSTGKCIARKCDGLPLSIAVVGNSLAVASSTVATKKLTEKWWEAVSEDVTTYVTDYGSQHHVLERVEASYIKLPQRLQECFLYLGVFPEGHEIPVRTLIRLWIAEGLLRDKFGLILETSARQIREAGRGLLQNLEETAEKYLRDLIDRNLVMVVKSYGNGHIKTCRLHRLIYAFCKYKADEQDLHHGLNMTGDGPVSLSPNCRRLCIYSHLSKFLSPTQKARQVRSVLCFMDRDEDKVEVKVSDTIHECFKLLRVLECSHAKFTRFFPKSLSKLIHLRYISLSCDEIRFIPATVSSLRYLETLVVHTKSASVQLEANIWSMFQLRHLVTQAAIVLATRGKGKAGENLRTLTRLAPACCTGDVFIRVPNLKTLGIRGHMAALAEPESLKVLERLENLKMINESAADCQLHLECFPPTLKRLTLSGTYLKWECMSALGKIDTLEILKLKKNAFTGESWTNTDADAFAKLRFLLIEATDLVSWEASDDCFPSLRCLVLDNCGRLQKVPSALARSLEKLDVGNVSESVVESAREIQQEIARRQGQNYR